MKKIKTAVLVLLALVLLVACACTPKQEVEVFALNSEVTIAEQAVQNFDYTTLFSVSQDDQPVAVTTQMLDLSQLSAQATQFVVTCSYGGKSATVTVFVAHDVWEVQLSQQQITLSAKQVKYYNYGALFTVTKNGAEVGVAPDMVQTDVSEVPGTYTYTVTAGGQSQTLTVIVLGTVYNVQLSQQQVTVRADAVQQYNFNQLFSVTEDGVAVEITDDMVTTDLQPLPGTYTYTVTFGDSSQTLTIIVSDAYNVEIIPSYTTLDLPIGQVADYDVTMLFSLYVDGVAVQVEEDMIDASSLRTAQAGDVCTVSLTYQKGSTQKTAQVTVNVTENLQVVVETQNIVTYPNSPYLDLTTLFEVTVGGQQVEVTNQMISGTVNYSLQDQPQEIVLTYQGKQYISTVTVRRGVVISHATSDVISVKVGTDQQSYLFAEDFVVLVNGVRFRNLTPYINVEDVDFSTVGSYTATLQIPYNNSNKFGLTGPSMTIFEETITYNVVDVEYNLSLVQPTVSLPQGTQDYNYFGNLRLVRNGVNCTVGGNADWVNAIYCYAEVVTAPQDLSQTGTHLVELDVYVQGTKAGQSLGTPVRIAYYVEVVGQVQVTAQDATVFGGTTLYAASLFTVTDGNTQVPVTYDMLSGKADTFRAGVYTVTATYKGVSATAKVVVVNPQLVGVWQTGQTSIPQEEEDYDDSGAEDYWTEEGGYYSTEQTVSYLPTERLGQMTITADGKITVRGVEAQFIGAADQNTLYIQLGSYQYTLWYDDGVVVLNPDNSVRLSFNENKRPLVYFNTAMWNLDSVLTVNYGDLHVLQLTYSGYSYDLFHVTSCDGKRQMWYCLHVQLSEKTSSDTIYTVQWGQAQMAQDFVQQQGQQGSFTFQGVTTRFQMQSDGVGKVDRSGESKEWANKVFTGVVDGKTAQLAFNQYEGFDYYIDGIKQLTIGTYELNNMKNGGANHAEGTMFVYSYGGDLGVFSLKFAINTQDNTFTLMPQDGLFGNYQGTNSFFFLDGYGTGIASFNTNSYEVTQFQYTKVNNQVTVTFFNTKASFAYGRDITFSLADLKNVLTVRQSQQEDLLGQTYTNSVITDGAIVTFTQSVFVANSANFLENIYQSVVVVTKDGQLTTEQKKATVQTDEGSHSVVDLSCVSNRRSGFYQISVTVTVDGAPKTTWFAVQVLNVATDAETLFGSADLQGMHNLFGTLNTQNRVMLDNYGNATVIAEGTTYTGYYLTDVQKGKFVVKAYAPSGTSVQLQGTLAAEGVFELRCSGACSFVDYFAKGTRSVAGCADNVLRKISSTSDVYLWAVAANSLGEFVTLQPHEGDSTLFTVMRSNGQSFVAKVVWGTSATSGLTLSDSVRGTYQDGQNTLVLDGFGNATLNGSLGTYVAEVNAVTVHISGAVYAYSLNLAEGTATPIVINLAAAVAGKTYTSTHVFYVDDTMYFATTSFAFSSGGKVTITSQCTDYAEDFGTYAPNFVGEGTYSAYGNVITVKIGAQTFAFTTQNVIQCTNVECQSTTLAESDQGYFAAGTQFALQ